MKYKAIYFLITCFSLYSTLYAQNQKPCTSEGAKQFDFWLGEWNASWEGGQGVNKISKILGGCVVFEEFDATPSSPLIGKSLSVFSPRSGEWHQTWVDNSGGYLDFSGKTIQRMVWYNISDEKFDWNWEKSVDDGKTWTISWKINYTRKK